MFPTSPGLEGCGGAGRRAGSALPGLAILSLGRVDLPGSTGEGFPTPLKSSPQRYDVFLLSDKTGSPSWKGDGYRADNPEHLHLLSSSLVTQREK